MDRPNRILGIIAERRPLGDVARSVQSALESLRKRLAELESARAEVVSRLAAGPPRARLEAIRFADLVHRAGVLEAAVATARQRFTRSRVQIGVLGRAGQGKSRLLQILSGLDSSVIPSGSHGHCTGTRSTIVHDESAVPPRARVEFYSEQEFLRVGVHAYCDRLAEKWADAVRARPMDLDQFAEADLHAPALERIMNTGGDDATKLAHLRANQSALAAFRNLLGRGAAEVPHESIRDYVAQEYDVDGAEVVKQHA